jgi:hypothetical protein
MIIDINELLEEVKKLGITDYKIAECTTCKKKFMQRNSTQCPECLNHTDYHKIVIRNMCKSEFEKLGTVVEDKDNSSFHILIADIRYKFRIEYWERDNTKINVVIEYCIGGRADSCGEVARIDLPIEEPRCYERLTDAMFKHYHDQSIEEIVREKCKEIGKKLYAKHKHDLAWLEKHGCDEAWLEKHGWYKGKLLKIRELQEGIKNGRLRAE